VPLLLELVELLLQVLLEFSTIVCDEDIIVDVDAVEL
jgi:hypothetical protein